MDRSRYRALAGTALVTTGAVTTLGFAVAAALVPGYSVSTQTISALGSPAGTAGSRAVFGGTVVVAGLSLLVAGYGLHRVYRRPLLTAVVAVTGGVGFVGVGLFPLQTGLPHLVAALVAFAGGGVSALVAATTVDGPFGYASASLGVLELAALVLFVALGGATPLGVGGLERVVAHLGLLWAVAFGGFLLARA